MITLPLLMWIYGAEYWNSENSVKGLADFILSYVFPFVAVVTFWVYKAGTPGKLVLGLRVVNATSGENITVGQAIGRYLAYFPAMIPLMMGIFWVGWDSKKQGWHDKLAGTVVIRNKNYTEKVQFSK